MRCCVGCFLLSPLPSARVPWKKVVQPPRGRRTQDWILDSVSGVFMTGWYTSGGDKRVVPPLGIQGSSVLRQSTGHGIWRLGLKCRLLVGGPEAWGSPLVLKGDKPS